ncbi:MAG: Ig-like domain-containing protein, partial [bacterium]|nr:Ig-like domain-containing protein [bacterium]
ELGSMMAGQPTGSSSTTGGVAVSTLTAPDWGTIRTGSVESEKRGVSKITVTAGDVDGVPMAVNDICRVIFTGTPKTFFITMNELGIPATTATIRAGNAMSFYSYAEDEYGHPLAPATRENPSYATVNFLPGGERSSFSPTADTHNPAGIATAKFTASTRTIDSPAAVTARMRCMGYISYAENTVITTIMPEKLDHFAFEQHGGGAVNGQPTYTTIWAYDQYDNLKTDYVGSTTIRAQGGKGSIGNGATCSFAADDKGRVDHQPVYTTNFLTKDNPTETITMTVADGPAKGTTGSITIYGGSGTVPGTVSVMASSGPYKAGSSDTLITATVYDNLGIPVKGKPISFTIDNNGSVSPSSAVTDESGRATANVTVAKKAGVVHTITAATSGLAAVNTKITVDANEPAGNLSVVPATASAVAGTADECTTTVVDAYGNPVNGTVVNFKATAQDNSVVGMSAAISGTDGKAKSTFQTNDAGTYTIKAWIGDEAAPAAEGTTTVTVKAGTAARIEVASGNSQSGVINSSLAEFKVRIVDANNNPVNGIAVTFAQTKKPTGADDMEIGNPTTVTGTDSVLGDGIASSGRIAVGDYPGTYKMTATSGTLAGSPVTATFEIVSDTPEITKAFVDGAPLADANKIYLNDATVTLRLEGSGFKEGMRVWLMAGAFNTPKITAGVIDPMQATAVISTADFPPAPTEGWSICAQNTTSSVFDELPDAFNTIYRQPIITGATPGSGEVNSTLTMAVTGEYFRAGAEATLVRGSDTIAADETIVADNVSLECRFTLPAEGGKSWNLVVTNDDGKDYSLANAVMVAWPAPSVTAIAPDTGNTGETAKSITVTGSNFYDNASVRISKNGADLAAIPGTGVAVTGGNTITALFNLSDPY